MRAVAVSAVARRVGVIEADPPAIAGPDEVLLGSLDIGICGTDREIGAFEYGTPPAGSDHLILGHEALAEVLDVGPGVELLRPGDLVVPTVRRPCPDPACRACRAGHQDYCYTGAFTERGIKEAHGYMAELVVEAERNLVAVPAHLRAVAVLTEPLTIAEKALGQLFWLAQHRPPWVDPAAAPGERGRGLSALVLGLGPVGILGAMALLSAGFRTTVYSREQPPSDRIDLVASLGATYASSELVTAPELAEELGNIDVVYEAVGQSGFALEVLRVLGHNGVFILTGVPGLEAFVRTDPASLMREMVLKNQVLVGSVNAGADAFQAALADIERFERRWPDVTRSLIGGRYPPEEAAELIAGRPAGIKSVVCFEAT